MIILEKLWLKRIFVSLLLIGIGVMLSFAIFIQYTKLYPKDDDSKNIEYVLLKHDLNENMNLDSAVSAMTHDTWAVELVAGKTKDQLIRRFGFIKTYERMRPYDRYCADLPGTLGERGIHAKGKEVVTLRDSDWLVILENGKAADLALCKGC